jgi:hypothetical protein
MSGARTLPTLPAFTTGQELTSSELNQIVAYQAFWANPPMFRMYQATGTPVTTGTNTQVTCDGSSWDSDNGRQSATPYNYVIPFYGRWEFRWSVAFPPNTTGSRLGMIYQNGTRVPGDVEVGEDNDYVEIDGTQTVLCNVDDIIGLWCWQNSGSSLTLATGTADQSWFEGKLVSFANP